MGNKYLETSFLDKAIIFAVKAHAGTERRGKGYPYIVHPLEAVEIVATITPDQELLAAAALHDTVEDTDVTIDDIRREFGEKVASLVASESDVVIEGLSEAESWRARKQAAIDRLANASHEAKIVALGDKLSNMRAIARDYARQGDKLWSLFHAPGGRKDHDWHYRGLAGALCDLSGTFAYTEFVSLIDKVFNEPQPEMIDMSDYEESGDGYTAVSYNHRGGKRMMKLYADFIPRSEPMKELRTSWEIMKMGMKIPAAYRLVTDGKRIGVEFQRITPKKSFARAVSQEPGKAESYGREFAREVKTLHSTQCNTLVFPSKDEFYRNAVNASQWLSPEQKAKILAAMDEIPAATTCLHGDLHVGNMITTGTENYWIDLSDFAYGNPAFDLGMFYLVSHLGIEEMTMKLYHMDCATMLRIWNAFVEEYFGSQEEYVKVEKRVRLCAALQMLYYSARNGMQPFEKKFILDNLPFN